MKKLLPMEQPKLICHHHLTSADAILRANAKDQIHKLFCAHHINCYFQNDFQQYKFVISIHDYWAMNKKYTEAQSILFLKETYRAQAIDFVSLIKKSLDVDSYVLVSCNRSYIEHAGDEEDSQYPCLIAGYDDFSHTFTIYGFDRDNRYICFHMDYTVFSDALWDTSDDSILFTLRRCRKNAHIPLDIKSTVQELDDYLNATTSKKVYTGDQLYGIAAIRALSSKFAQSQISGQPLYEPCLQKFALHKRLMKERVEFFATEGILSPKWISFAQDGLNYGEDVLDLGRVYNQTRNEVSLHTILENIETTVEMESDYLKGVLKELKDTKQ